MLEENPRWHLKNLLQFIPIILKKKRNNSGQALVITQLPTLNGLKNGILKKQNVVQLGLEQMIFSFVSGRQKIRKMF
jgi:hypothetical protein